MSAEQSYASTIIKRFGGYVPVWYPTQNIAIGDVLIFDGAGALQKIGALSDFGVSYQTTPGAIAAPINFTNSSKVSITFKASGQTSASMPAIPNASAGISIDFENSGDFTLQANKATETLVADIINVQTQLRPLLANNVWKTNYLVAGKVLKADIFSLVLSQSDSTNVQFSLNLPQGQTPALNDLANASAQATLATQDSSVVEILNALNATPLVAPLRLVPTLFGERELKFVTS